MDFADYSVKNVKVFQGMEGMGFNATLYNGSKRIALLIDEGQGGEVLIRWRPDTQAEQAIFSNHIERLPLISMEGFRPFSVDESIFAEEIVLSFLGARDKKRMEKSMVS